MKLIPRMDFLNWLDRHNYNGLNDRHLNEAISKLKMAPGVFKVPSFNVARRWVIRSAWPRPVTRTK